MAARKTTTRRKTTTARRRTPARKTTTVRRRRTPAKKGMLSELFNPKLAQSSAKAMASGAAGGFAAATILKMTPNQTATMQNVYLGATAFVAASMLKAPNVAAGITGVTIFRLMESSGMLNDDFMEADFAEPIEALPMVLNEDGSENMYLSEQMYLSEDLMEGFDYQPDYIMNAGGNY
jgi:hypothetical protein